MVEENKPEENVQKGTEQTQIHSFKDTGVGTIFEGVEKVETKELFGKEIIIKDFKELPSTFGEGKTYLIVLAEKEGKDITFPIGSGVLIHDLHELRRLEKLPCRLKIVEKQSKEGRTYQSFE